MNSLKTIPSNMMIQNYVCRFVPYHSKIHVLTPRTEKKKTKKTNKDTFLTVPFRYNYKDKSENKTNVIVSFICPSHAMTMRNNIQEYLSFELDIQEINIKDLSYQAFIMKIPCVTIMNSFCDIEEKKEKYDIFYTTKYLTLEDDYEKRDLANPYGES